MRGCALALALMLGLSACQVGILVDINLNTDGSGVVTVEMSLDPEVLALVPEIVSLALTEDIQNSASGWVYRRPRTDGEGYVRFSASKEFASLQQLELVLAEVFHSDEAFRDFSFERDTSFAKTDYRFTGVVDLSGGVDLIADPELTKRLDGQPLGEPVGDLNVLLSAVTVEVGVALPVGPRQSVALKLGQAAEQLEVVAQQRSVTAVTLRWVAYAGFALLGLALLIAVAGYLLERRAEGRGLESSSSQAGLLPTSSFAESESQRRRLQLVALNPLGVLFQPARNPSEFLGEFVRQRGYDVAQEELEDLYRQAVLGRITPAEFWDGMGIIGDFDAGDSDDDSDTAGRDQMSPEALSEEFTARYTVRSGARDFVAEMVRRDLPVVCVANDVSAWSLALRKRFPIAGIDTWILSSDVGVCMPATGIYEALRRITSISYENILLVDVNVQHLDAAQALGMSTALFAGTSSSEADASRHAVVNSFSDFFRRRSWS
ncbi:MAG: hypothetical protein F4X48_00405 [Acidimicrobiia bacterium]|nr:hypothetical protein [Acidimicrobiia bacterium]MYC57041.1 hypothetical protein [Acidimicrobiia bacterium]